MGFLGKVLKAPVKLHKKVAGTAVKTHKRAAKKAHKMATSPISGGRTRYVRGNVTRYKHPDNVRNRKS